MRWNNSKATLRGQAIRLAASQCVRLRYPGRLTGVVVFIVTGAIFDCGEVHGAPTATASVRVVVLGTPSLTDQVGTLPTSLTQFNIGETFYAELWAQTPDPAGFTQVSADIQFDPSALTAVSVTPTALFNFGPSGDIDNVAGLIDNLSGAHPPVIPACSDQVGVAPFWARVATVEMSVIGSGPTSLLATEAADGIHFVAICGQLDPPTTDFLGVDLTIAPPVPALTTSGMIVLGALMMVAGARRLNRGRRSALAEGASHE